MENEYVLQVLFDAYVCTYEVNEEKYTSVYTSKLYKKYFKPWINLLKLIEFPEKFQDFDIFSIYSKCKLL